MHKALFITGGWDGHEPVRCAEIVAKAVRERGLDSDTVDTLEILNDAENLAPYSVIIPVWTMGTIEKEQSQTLRKVIASGVGLAGWHGGMCDSFRQDTEYQFMTGGQWVVHPGGIVKYRVNVKQDTEGFMDGIRDFDMESEQYYMHTDPGNEVLATTLVTGEHGDVPWVAGTIMPVAWKRMYGKGRVFYSSLGHVAKDFEVREVLEIMVRGIFWAEQR